MRQAYLRAVILFYAFTFRALYIFGKYHTRYVSSLRGDTRRRSELGCNLICLLLRGPQGVPETPCLFDIQLVEPVTVNGQAQCAYLVRPAGPLSHWGPR